MSTKITCASIIGYLLTLKLHITKNMYLFFPSFYRQVWDSAGTSGHQHLVGHHAFSCCLFVTLNPWEGAGSRVCVVLPSCCAVKTFSLVAWENFVFWGVTLFLHIFYDWVLIFVEGKFYFYITLPHCSSLSLFLCNTSICVFVSTMRMAAFVIFPYIT